jgi:hypothetical protein
MNLPFNLDVIANLSEIDPKLAVQEVQNAPFQAKYVKNPNPAGIKVSDEMKKRTKKGWFSTTYPSRQNIESVLTAIRSEYGLPVDKHIQDLTRILRFAKSPRATNKEIYKKIFAYKETHPGVLEDIQATYSGWTRSTSPPEKKAMIAAIENIINSVSGRASEGMRGVVTGRAGIKLSVEQPLPEREQEGSQLRVGSFRDDDYYGMAGGGYKIAAPTRKMKQKQQRQQMQQGGGVTMPLGFYQHGAQMNGTYGSETGVGLGVMTEHMARSAVLQTGGKKKATRKAIQRKQRGGFAPSVMGSFAANGLSLLPVASYMGYRMMNKGTRKGKAGRTGRKRQTRRH